MTPSITLLSARPPRGLAHGCSISPSPGPFRTGGVLALPKGQNSMSEMSNAAAASIIRSRAPPGADNRGNGW